MHEGSRRAILAALFANLGIAVAKFVAYLATGASSMLAEAVHSVADTGNQALLILGGTLAKREPTQEHPFGYGRERYFWSFVVAVVLFSLGSLFALYEGSQKLFHPHEVASPGWAIGVLGIAIGLETLSFRTAIREANPLRAGRSWWAFVRHAKSPELPVVLLEDLGALLGLVLALLGIGATLLTGDARFDAAATLAIGLLLGAIAALLAIEMKSLLIGEAAGPQQRADIRSALVEAPHVERVIHMRTIHLGPEELLVAAKIELDSALTFDAVAAAVDGAEAAVRGRVPSARLIYLEPDVHRPERAREAPSSAAPEACP